jgi:hypothetical protein
MQALLYGVAVLACPVGMGLMMWMMMRGQRTSGADTAGAKAGEPSSQQVAALRAEIDQLKSDRAARRAPGGQ